MELYFVKEYLTISDLKAKKIPIKITGLNLPQSNSIAPWMEGTQPIATEIAWLPWKSLFEPTTKGWRPSARCNYPADAGKVFLSTSSQSQGVAQTSSLMKVFN